METLRTESQDTDRNSVQWQEPVEKDSLAGPYRSDEGIGASEWDRELSCSWIALLTVMPEHSSVLCATLTTPHASSGVLPKRPEGPIARYNRETWRDATSVRNQERPGLLC